MKKLIELNGKIPVVRQCELLGISRSGYYYRPKGESPKNISLMNRIDEIYTRKPYYGIRKITAQLRREGKFINRKRIARLMKIMGIQAICPRRNTSKSHPEHAKYPYLLRGLEINRPNQVWGTDITYVRANGVWFYLVAIMDWHSRYVLSWRLSQSLTSKFCVEALEEALKIAIPEFHNSDQGSQFTAEEYLNVLKRHPQIQISMDGRGRCFDNIFNERLWRNVKYEEIYLKDYASYREAEESLREYFWTYNHERLHQSLNYQTPAEVYFSNQITSFNMQKVETRNLICEHVS